MTDTKEIKNQKQADKSNEDNLLKQDADSAQTGMEEDLLDDENTIDRLLMKEDFAELEEIPGEENDLPANASADTAVAEGAKIDEFADDEEDLLEPGAQSEADESDGNGANDDFLMADFDISGDEEFAEPAAAETVAAVDEPPPSSEEKATAPSEAPIANPQTTDSGGELVDLHNKVDSLQKAMESLQAQAESQPEELEKLAREQKKSTIALHQTLQKSALLAKGALAAAILALIGIGVMAALFFASQGDVEQLQ